MPDATTAEPPRYADREPAAAMPIDVLKDWHVSRSNSARKLVGSAPRQLSRDIYQRLYPEASAV